jgi:hypothetical protein
LVESGAEWLRSDAGAEGFDLRQLRALALAAGMLGLLAGLLEKAGLALGVGGSDCDYGSWEWGGLEAHGLFVGWFV